MNPCLNCGEPVKNKYCNFSCQNKHQNPAKADKRWGLFKDFIVICSKCFKQFTVNERDKLFPQKEKYYCGYSCSNSRVLSQETKDKIRDTLAITRPRNWIRKKKELVIKQTKTIIIYKCLECDEEYQARKITQVCCSRYCAMVRRNRLTNICVIAGKKSAQIQSKVRRSKNEIYFSELCEEHYHDIQTNEPIFNGWDADVIIPSLKVAILWNGKWHYEKLTKKHSVTQVQNRDKIKIKEIIIAGYKPYIIKDMGKFNKNFVKEEFIKFKNFINEMTTK